MTIQHLMCRKPGFAALMHAQIVGRVKVGALPVHGYNIPQLGQFWAHSDIDGTFFVISVDNIDGSAASVAVSAITWPCIRRTLRELAWHQRLPQLSQAQAQPVAGSSCLRSPQEQQDDLRCPLVKQQRMLIS